MFVGDGLEVECEGGISYLVVIKVTMGEIDEASSPLKETIHDDKGKD